MPEDFFFPILAPIDTFTKSITSVVSPCCLLASLARFKFKKSLIVSVYCIHLNKIFFPSYLTSSVVGIHILMDGIETKTITIHFRMKTKLRIYAWDKIAALTLAFLFWYRSYFCILNKEFQLNWTKFLKGNNREKHMGGQMIHSPTCSFFLIGPR